MKVVKVSPAHTCKPTQHRYEVEITHECVKLMYVANVGSQLTGPIAQTTFAEQGIMVVIVKPGTTLRCYIKLQPQAEDKTQFHNQQGKIDR